MRQKTKPFSICRWLTALLLFCTETAINAQVPSTSTQTSTIDHSYKPFIMKLDEKGDKYIRFATWHQFWTTVTDNNPGTLDANGQVQERAVDIALRRSRFLTYAQVSPKFMILTHFGVNNQSFATGGSAIGGNQAALANNGGKKPQLFVHEATTEYEVVKDKLYLGAGLHYWNGISRLSSSTTNTIMALDLPIFNFPLIETNDQFARQLGLYAKGQVGKFDYRFAINKPFLNGLPANRKDFVNAFRSGSVGNGIATHAFSERLSTSGYVSYQFKDKESNKLPYCVGTHLGGKSVFNVGAGFYTQPEATASLSVRGSDTTFATHNIELFGVDAFADFPVNKAKGTFFSIYGVAYLYDFGPNFLRSFGILNLHTNVTPTNATLSRGGNAQPIIGSGTIGYLQMGYGLPKQKNGSQFMPYITFAYKDFEQLKDPSLQYDLGINYFINGHNAKVSLQYSDRPLYNTNLNRDGSKGEFILQTQIFL